MYAEGRDFYSCPFYLQLCACDIMQLKRLICYRKKAKMYTSIYADETPLFIEQLVNTTEIRRLCDVGMHCGVEYANFPIYQQQKIPYSRLTHSVGVSKIVWNFTHDIRQAISGLLHDIATPVFAHTIDFLCHRKLL